MSPASSFPASRPMLGIGLKIASVLVFVAMQTCLKALGEGVPAGQMVFFRSSFALVPVALYLLWLGEMSTALRTADLPGHFLRGLIGVTSMGLGFYAIGRLPYPEWISISYAAPLLTVVFAVLFLRETVRLYRWIAVLVGLCGVLIVVAPNLTLFGDALRPGVAGGALAALAGAGFAAVAMIQIRRLVRRERTTTIVVYFSLTSSLLSLGTLALGWVWPSGEQLALLVAAGLCGGVGQLLLTACYRYADTSTIAPFEYTSMLLAVAIGYFLFEETASATTLAGGLVVIAAGVFIVFREHRLGLERRGARRAGERAP